MKRVAIIMAGGSGERFWPLSRRRRPKQLLNITSEKTMIRESIERISALIPPEDIFIITSALLLEPIRNELTELPAENIFAEPYKRNTAPCLALGASFIAERYRKEFSVDKISVAVLTADQMISPVEGFTRTVDGAMNHAETNNAIVTIGIQPDRPETGYGYIEVSQKFDNEGNVFEILPVIRFHEKPKYENAVEYLHTGRFLWNSGMFFYRLDVFNEKMIQYLPSVGNLIDNMSECLLDKTTIAYSDSLSFVDDIYKAFPDISIDFGLMEKADNVAVARAIFEWDDVGSWDSMGRFKSEDDAGNIFEGEIAAIDVSGSTIINKSDKKIIVAATGLKDTVIIVTEDAILVCPKDRVQEVKKNIELIRKLDDADKWL